MIEHYTVDLDKYEIQTIIIALTAIDRDLQLQISPFADIIAKLKGVLDGNYQRQTD